MTDQMAEQQSDWVEGKGLNAREEKSVAGEVNLSDLYKTCGSYSLCETGCLPYEMLRESVCHKALTDRSIRIPSSLYQQEPIPSTLVPIWPVTKQPSLSAESFYLICKKRAHLL